MMATPKTAPIKDQRWKIESSLVAFCEHVSELSEQARRACLRAVCQRKPPPSYATSIAERVEYHRKGMAQLRDFLGLDTGYRMTTEHLISDTSAAIMSEFRVVKAGQVSFAVGIDVAEQTSDEEDYEVGRSGLGDTGLTQVSQLTQTHPCHSLSPRPTL